jgi:hypothetical protein
MVDARGESLGVYWSVDKTSFAHECRQGGEFGIYSDVVPKTMKFIEQIICEGETDE